MLLCLLFSSISNPTITCFSFENIIYILSMLAGVKLRLRKKVLFSYFSIVGGAIQELPRGS